MQSDLINFNYVKITLTYYLFLFQNTKNYVRVNHLDNNR